MHLSIRHIAVEAEDILSLELVAADGRELPAFTAGAHIDLHLDNAAGPGQGQSQNLVRSYSLVNDPAERRRYVIAVNKDPASRGGSRCVHEQLKVGQTIEVGEPRNHFPLVEEAPLVVLIAGGIGITPLLSMIRRLEALRQPWKLFYSARSRAKCAYLKEVQALEAAQPGRVRLHFLDEASGQVPDLAAIVADVPPDAHLYCCGPVPMLQAFERAGAGRKPETVHVEYFSAQQEAATAGGFEVVLARSQQRLRVCSGQTILATLLGSGIDVPHACQEGVCGACQTPVLEGQPDHRDAFLTPREKEGGKTIMLCCSGARSQTLVLDL
jgi:vanillate O-demethylase ferredoxin subunit